MPTYTWNEAASAARDAFVESILALEPGVTDLLAVCCMKAESGDVPASLVQEAEKASDKLFTPFFRHSLSLSVVGMLLDNTVTLDLRGRRHVS
jgi:hypothetical protein